MGVVGLGSDWVLTFRAQRLLKHCLQCFPVWTYLWKKHHRNTTKDNGTWWFAFITNYTCVLEVNFIKPSSPLSFLTPTPKFFTNIKSQECDLYIVTGISYSHIIHRDKNNLHHGYDNDSLCSDCMEIQKRQRNTSFMYQEQMYISVP